MARKRTAKKARAKGEAASTKKGTSEGAGAKAPAGPKGEHAVGDRVRIVRGKGAGAVGGVFWVGESKWGEGLRYGLRDDQGETHWVEEGRLAAVSDTVVTPAAVDEPPSDALDQVAFFREKNPRLLRSPVYGELRWLHEGETPPLVQSTADAKLHRIVAWFAIEADGGVLGRLVLDGVPRALWPIVYLSNEGEAELSAFSLVDHLGAGLLDSPDGEIDPLLRFCRKHALPAPRPFPRALAKALRISDRGLREGKVPKVPRAKLEAHAAAAAPPAAKPKGPAPGVAVPPLADEVRCLMGADGTALVLAAKGGNSVRARVHRWTGEAFELTGELPTLAVNLHDGMLAYLDRAHVVLKAGRKARLRLPFTGSAALTQVAARGDELFVYDAYDGRLFRRAGDELVAVKGNAGEGGTLVFLDDQRVAVLGQRKGKSLVVDLRSGKTSRWSSGGVSSVLPMGDYVAGLAAAGHGVGITRLDLASKTWSKPKKTQSIAPLCPLRNGDAVTCADNGNVFVLRRSTFALRKVGKLTLPRPFTTRALEVAPNTVVFVGGTRRPSWEPLEPELIELDTGETRALPGRAKELQRQARLA